MKTCNNFTVTLLWTEAVSIQESGAWKFSYNTKQALRKEIVNVDLSEYCFWKLLNIAKSISAVVDFPNPLYDLNYYVIVINTELMLLDLTWELIPKEDAVE